MTTAVFIGTFDPLHGGHIGQLLRANHVVSLSKVLILIDKNPTHKPNASPWQHRLEMAKLTLKSFDLPFQHDVIPIENSLAQEITETIDYKITGIDSVIENASEPSRWAFITRWPLIILSIPDIEESALTNTVSSAPKELRTALRYTYINEEQAPMMNYDFQTKTFSKNRVHATHLRAGDNKAFIPPDVQQYINTNQLYSDAPRA